MAILSVLLAVFAGMLAVPAYARPSIVMVGDPAPELHAALLKSLNPDAMNIDEEYLSVERERLEDVVHSFGYLDGIVNEPTVPEGKGEEYATIEVRPGRLYTIASVQVLGLAGITQKNFQADIVFHIGAAVGKPARDDIVAAMIKELIYRVKGASFPKVEVTGREISVDRGSATAILKITLNTGAAATFGDVTFGSQGADYAAVTDYPLPFTTGEPFDPAAVDAYRSALMQVPLVRSVRIDVQLDEQNRANIDVRARLFANMPLLAYHRTLGIAVIGGTLLLLGFRQMTLALRRSPREPWGIALDIANLVMMILSAVLLVERAIMFGTGTY